MKRHLISQISILTFLLVAATLASAQVRPPVPRPHGGDRQPGRRSAHLPAVAPGQGRDGAFHRDLCGRAVLQLSWRDLAGRRRLRLGVARHHAGLVGRLRVAGDEDREHLNSGRGPGTGDQATRSGFGARRGIVSGGERTPSR